MSGSKHGRGAVAGRRERFEAGMSGLPPLTNGRARRQRGERTAQARSNRCCTARNEETVQIVQKGG